MTKRLDFIEIESDAIRTSTLTGSVVVRFSLLGT